ncbi:hypothetical protein [Caudoviricetes sp.]|nr:hypothetical protein [Caudoviricetes sp.]
MNRCKGCGKPIGYVRSTKSAKVIPLDFDLIGAPSDVNPKGALFYVSDDGTKGAPIENATAVLEVIRAGLKEVDALFDGHSLRIDAARVGLSHYKTCPEANSFGKKRKP